MALASRVSSYGAHGFEVMGSGVDGRRSRLGGMEKSVSLAVNGWGLERRTRALQLGVGGSGRGNRLVVGASPPTEDAVVMTEPLTKEDLVGYLASGCKAKEKWRIGTEHEKFGFEVGTLQPIKYEQIADLRNGLSERFDWDQIMEGDYVIGLKQRLSLGKGCG